MLVFSRDDPEKIIAIIKRLLVSSCLLSRIYVKGGYHIAPDLHRLLLRAGEVVRTTAHTRYTKQG